MDENQESKDKIVNELVKINKRLDVINSWVACFVIIFVIFFLVLLQFIVQF